MFEVSDVAEAVATRTYRFVKKYLLNSSIVCEICAICSKVFFSFQFHIYIMCYRFRRIKIVKAPVATMPWQLGRKQVRLQMFSEAVQRQKWETKMAG